MENGEITEEKIKAIEFIKTLEYWLPEGFGIWSVSFWGIGDLVRIQFSRNHVEILPFAEVFPLVMKHLDDESFRREGSIKDLNALEYTHVYVGEPGKAFQKSFVAYGNVIDLLNKRRAELFTLRKHLSDSRYAYLREQQESKYEKENPQHDIEEDI